MVHGKWMYSGKNAVHLFDEKRKEITVLSVTHVGLGSKLSMGASIAQVLQCTHDEQLCADGEHQGSTAPLGALSPSIRDECLRKTVNSNQWHPEMGPEDGVPAL